MDRCFPSILFNTWRMLAVLLMIPWKNLRKLPDLQESSSKMATMCIKNFVIYKLSHKSFPAQIWIYLAFLDLFGFLDCTNTCHVPQVGSGHLAVMKFFICDILFSAEFIRNPRKSSKLVMFGLGSLCAATKTILDLIRVEQMWLGWKANTLLSIPFWYCKIDPVFNITVALSQS